jgi:potassium voltage-gated channel Eag-related subfamily H protein 7
MLGMITAKPRLKAKRGALENSGGPILDARSDDRKEPTGEVAVQEVAPSMTVSRLTGLAKEQAMLLESEATILAFEQKLKTMRAPDNAGWLILDPRSAFRKQWDLVMIALLLFTATVTPWEVGMGIPTELTPLFVVNQLVNFMFVWDMAMNFMLAEQDVVTGQWMMAHGAIAKRYLQSWFLIDFLSILPFDSLGLALDDPTCSTKPRSARDACISDLKIFRIIRLLRLLKLLRILRASRIFKRWEQQMGMAYSKRSLLKFFVYLSFLAHWIACVHRLLPQIEGTERLTPSEPLRLSQGGNPIMNWMDAYGIDYMRKALGADLVSLVDNPAFAGDWHMYTVSLYWSCMTLSTIGYGDIPVRTHSERTLAIFCMLVGAGTYAYMVGAICGIVASMDPLGAEFNQTMDSLNAYMREADLPPALRHTLRAYFYHCKRRMRIRSYHALLEKMSPALRGAVAAYVHGPTLERVEFFCVEGGKETPLFLTQICMRLGAEAYGPQEVVIARSSPADRMFIVSSGIASKEGIVFTRGAYFGDDFILTEARREYRVLAVNFLDVYTVRRADLVDVLAVHHLPRTRAKIRLAMIRLAFFRRIRPLIYQMWKTDPAAFELPASILKKAERYEAVLTGVKIVRAKLPSEKALHAQCMDELAGVVRHALAMPTDELGSLLGTMGEGLTKLGAEAATAMEAAAADTAPIFASRRMSGHDLDVSGHNMGQDNYAAGSVGTHSPKVGRKILLPLPQV